MTGFVLEKSDPLHLKVLPCRGMAFPYPGLQCQRHETLSMPAKYSNYYSQHEEKTFPAQKQLITYSYNQHERSILGIMEEREGLIYLYEYRGALVGIEFFISFSKQSISYKLIKVDQMAAESSSGDLAH